MQDITKFGAALGVAIIILAVAYGMSKIGQACLEAISRQPEAADKIQGAMVIALALIEGAALFAIVVCLLVVVR